MLAIGTRLGPYQILAPLGHGGMGEVYRARDVRLDREVAVKVVPPLLALRPDLLARFEREARAVAALAHPNILVLFDVGREGDIPFAVTELLGGANLRARLTQGALPWREALEIGAAVSDGLAAAHARGIIHRDIKPENLFLTADGRVKILDFGLARFELPEEVPETGAYIPGQTDPGTVLGTVAYMAPEQLRGKPVDGRADLFSLGCVLYEMVAGERPFRGATATAIAAAILYEEPAELAGGAADVPREVEVAIRQCLAKEPAKRAPSARDLAFMLRALLAGSGIAVPPAPAGAPRRRREALLSLAVLPLVNASESADAEYLSDGLTEGVINRLSRLGGLRVMARNTVFRYKGRDMDAREVGQSLNVRAVLAGRLVQRGERLALSVELVDARDGALLWGERFDRPLAELQAVEKALAGAIADALRLRLTGEQKRELGRPGTESHEAYRCYLRGRYFWNKRSGEGLRKSIKLFEEAIDLDPTYALAYVGVADAYLNLGGWGHLPNREAYPRARAAAERALAIDDGLAEAHVSLAMALKEYDWDFPAAGRAYARALEINPNYAVAHQWYGEYLAALGRHDEAIASLQRALELGPLDLVIHATLGRHGYYFARRYDEAIAQLRKTLEMDEHFWVARLWLGWTCAVTGRVEEGLAELDRARRLEDNLEVLMALGYAQGRAGRPAEARRLLDELRQLSRTRYVSPMLGVLIMIGLGEHDEAFDWLERAYEDRVQMLSEMAAEPAFDPLRGDRRFADLLRRVGLGAAGMTQCVGEAR